MPWIGIGKLRRFAPPTMMMRYFVGILVFVFCNVIGNSTEAGRTDLREEPFRSQSVDAIVELRDDLDVMLRTNSTRATLPAVWACWRWRGASRQCSCHDHASAILQSESLPTCTRTLFVGATARRWEEFQSRGAVREAGRSSVGSMGTRFNGVAQNPNRVCFRRANQSPTNALRFTKVRQAVRHFSFR
jgi:hypothetical protein